MAGRPDGHVMFRVSAWNSVVKEWNVQIDFETEPTRIEAQTHQMMDRIEMLHDVNPPIL